jgi:signal transduction histidine kinase
LAEVPSARPRGDIAANLRHLIAGARATGLDVRLHLAGHPDQVSAEPAILAYRVVQESITNALKHSPGAPIDVSVDCAADVIIDVVNAIAPVAGSHLATMGGGHGLAGIKDRVDRLWETFAAGPEIQGPWRVSVCFPSR